MGQKMDPHGLRVGIIKDWDSKWYANKKDFADNLVEDYEVRKFLKKAFAMAGVSKVEIERTAKMIRANVYTGKPGIALGKSGETVNKVRADLTKKFKKDMQTGTFEDVAGIFGENLVKKKKYYVRTDADFPTAFAE